MPRPMRPMPPGLSGPIFRRGPRPAPLSIIQSHEARAVARRLERAGARRAPIGFGDPPRAEVRLAPVLLAPVFLAGGILAALLIALLRSI